MTYSTFVFAAEAPAGEPPAVLMPAAYDMIWGGLSFLIVLILFWKFVLPALQRVLKERADKIEGGIHRAEQMQEEARLSLEEYRQQLAEARSEAADIRAAAQQDKAQIIEEARAEASAAAAAVSAQAAAQIEAERSRAIIELRSEVSSLATDLASRIVGESLTDDARATAVVDSFIAELEQSSAKDGSQ